jgi:hypothetical protein
VLDPRFKLAFFKEAGWTSGQLERARDFTEQAWKALYKPNETVLGCDNGPQTIVEELWADIASDQVEFNFENYIKFILKSVVFATF